MIMHKDNKGFTPLQINLCMQNIFKNYIFKYSKRKFVTGFTFVELIVATVILGIAVAGVYAAFLSSVKFTGAFRHEVMAAILTDSLLQQVRAEYEHTDPDDTTSPYAVDDATNGAVANPPDFSLSTFTLDDQLDGEVENLTNTGYTVTDENLSADGFSNQEYSFKRITITVEWDERAI